MITEKMPVRSGVIYLAPSAAATGSLLNNKRISSDLNRPINPRNRVIPTEIIRECARISGILS